MTGFQRGPPPGTKGGDMSGIPNDLRWGRLGAGKSSQSDDMRFVVLIPALNQEAQKLMYPDSVVQSRGTPERVESGSVLMINSQEK